MNDVLNWFEIPCTDIVRGVRFYERLLGTELRRSEFMGVPHGMFLNGEGTPVGALVQDPRSQPALGGSVLYLDARGDLDGCVRRAPEAGGKVLLPKTSIGPQGFIAILQDSEGNRIGLHSP